MLFYKDAPPTAGFESSTETENLVMHACLDFDGETIMFCDMPPSDPVNIGGNIAIMLRLESITVIKTIFEALKVGGTVIMEPEKQFWSECFCCVKDKFGIIWNIAVSD
jgi:PhnB protein